MLGMPVLNFTFCLGMVLILAGCGGGGLEGPVAQFDYSNAAEVRHSYTPYATGSHGYLWATSDDEREIYLGGDLESQERLRHVVTDNGIRYFIGASRDGVGVDRLQNYEDDLITQNETDPEGLSGHGFLPFNVQPSLYFDPDLLAPENAGIVQALADSIFILNDILPPEFQILVVESRASISVNPGEIIVRLESPAAIRSICGTNAVACAQNTSGTGHTVSSVLHLPDDFNVDEYTYPRSVIVHELLHALGIQGHVDSIEFPDSVMGTAGEHIPNLGYIISKIDREVLQIMYMSQRTDIYNDWGEWSDTTFHLVGRSDDEALNFGVALFNGLPQPWVRGALPDTILADNELLSGTATWTGSLLGFSGPSPIAGDAELQVFMETLATPDSEQDLRFRDIAFVNRFESDSPDRWFDTRDIDYKVTVFGNRFFNVRGEGYEQGLVTGAFLGSEHEHMGGTVKRTDMVAAFGGSRAASENVVETVASDLQ